MAKGSIGKGVPSEKQANGTKVNAKRQEKLERLAQIRDLFSERQMQNYLELRY